MKTKHLLLSAFAIIAVLQAAAPLKMIYDSETTERLGTTYKFKTEPIDPTDPFRGKYITLNYDVSTIPTKDTTWLRNEKVYVVFGTATDGFAKVTDVSREKPESGDYVFTKVAYYYTQDLHINLPFDRYYMDEDKAYEAETAYRDYNRDAKAKPAYALVALKDGNAVVKDVIIDGIPIKDYVLKEREEKK